MTDPILGKIVGIVGTLAGVVLGYLLTRAQARAARKGELRSLLEAARSELLDANSRALAGPSALPFQVPTLELIVQRGMLGELSPELRQRLLKARTLLTAYNVRDGVVWDPTQRGGARGQQAGNRATPEARLASSVAPLVDPCVVALDVHLKRLSTRWPRRLWNWLRRTTTTAG